MCLGGFFLTEPKSWRVRGRVVGADYYQTAVREECRCRDIRLIGWTLGRYGWVESVLGEFYEMTNGIDGV